MTSEFWELRRIDSLGRIITGKTPSSKNPEYFDGPFPFITIPDLEHKLFMDETERSISNAGAEKLNNSVIPKNSVCVSCIATIGRVGLTTKPSITNQQINSIVCNDDVDPIFLYYAMCHFSHDLKFFTGGGAVVANISKSLFGKMEIFLPPFLEQKSIGEKLLLLDKLIRKNKEKSEVHSKLIETLFRSWFIDFDPVKAKAEGKLPYGMDEETAALFPDSFEDSELGPIPAGWKVGAVEDILDVSWGDTDVTKKSYSEDGFPAFSAKGQDGYLQYYDYEQWGIVLSAIGANCGNTWIASGKWSCIKNTMRFIELKAENEFVPYFYYLSKNPYFWPIRGSAQPFIGMNDVKKIKILIPNSALIQKFSELSKKMLDTLHVNETIGEKLSRARDTLLPRLMSGELEVPMEA